MKFTTPQEKCNDSCKTTFGGSTYRFITVCCFSYHESRILDHNGFFSLHNDVYIKIVIIYKNRKNSQNILKFHRNWSIVSVQHEFYGHSLPIFLLAFRIVLFL
jgi:hypothetical protein